MIVIDLTDEDAGEKFGSRLCYIPVMTECAVVDDQQQGNKGEEEPFYYIRNQGALSSKSRTLPPWIKG